MSSIAPTQRTYRRVASRLRGPTAVPHVATRRRDATGKLAWCAGFAHGGTNGRKFEAITAEVTRVCGSWTIHDVAGHVQAYARYHVVQARAAWSHVGPMH